MKLNNFAWFMNGCYTIAFLTLIIFQIKGFKTPILIYISLLLGFLVNIVSQQKKENK
jgi:hypothetical protein